MRSIYKALIITGVLLLTNLLTYCSTRKHVQSKIEQSVVTRIDTVTLTDLIPDTTYITKYIKVPVRYADTITIHETFVEKDTLFVALPRSVHSYSGTVGSSSYDLTISGYDPKLESLTIASENSYITKEVIKSPRFAFNAFTDVDYGCFNKSVDFSIGIEAPINLGKVSLSPQAYVSIFNREVFVGARVSYDLAHTSF